MEALSTGLSIPAPGFHIFVSGLIGSGRAAVVEMLLRDIRPRCDRVADRVFVHNFREPNRPLLVTLPAGRAATFRDELEDLGHALHAALFGALRSRPHRMSRRVVLRSTESRDRRIMDALQRQAQKQGCSVVRFQSQNGTTTVDIYPVVDGEPVTLDALSALVLEGKLGERERDSLLESRGQMLERLGEVNERIRSEHLRVAGELREMDRRVAWNVLRAQTAGFRQRWPQREVADWLDAAGEFVERHLHQFAARDEDDEDAETVRAQGEARATFPGFETSVAKTSLNDACPVVIESNPTYANLFGTITSPRDGTVPGPQHVHGGAMLRADGGYLVLRCLDVLNETGVWQQLKRTLQTRFLEIREFDQTVWRADRRPAARGHPDRRQGRADRRARGLRAARDRGRAVPADLQDPRRVRDHDPGRPEEPRALRGLPRLAVAARRAAAVHGRGDGRRGRVRRARGGAPRPPHHALQRPRRPRARGVAPRGA